MASEKPHGNGSLYWYSKGCRCPECRAEKSKRQKVYMDHLSPERKEALKNRGRDWAHTNTKRARRSAAQVRADKLTESLLQLLQTYTLQEIAREVYAINEARRRSEKERNEPKRKWFDDNPYQEP